jgi:hypothetical protein
MTKMLLALALFALGAQFSAAAEWTYVGPVLGKSSAGAKVKGVMDIDAGSVVAVDNATKAWFRLSYKSDTIDPAVPAKPIRKVKFLYLHLCEEHKRALLQLVYEDASGATVYSASFPSSPTKFDDVIPDTTGESWLKAACKIAAMKHKTAAKP